MSLSDEALSVISVLQQLATQCENVGRNELARRAKLEANYAHMDPTSKKAIEIREELDFLKDKPVVIHDNTVYHRAVKLLENGD